MQLLVLALLVPLCLAVPKLPHKKFPAGIHGFPIHGKPFGFGGIHGIHGKGFPIHGKFPGIHHGFGIHGANFHAFSPLAGILPTDGSCAFYTMASFIAQIEDQLDEKERSCSVAGCTVADHVSFTIEACNNLNMVSKSFPKGNIHDVEKAQPKGTTTISFKCSHGILTAEGFVDPKPVVGVLVVDQLDCYPCRFYTSSHEIFAAVGVAGPGIGSCDEKGTCDLHPGAAVDVHAWPKAGYDLVQFRSFAKSIWVSVPKDTYQFTLSCENAVINASGFEQADVVADVRVIRPNALSFGHPRD